jgi:hypothetical protein
MEKNIYSPKLGSTFPHLQKKFQIITMKIDIMGTSPNFQLSLQGTIVLLGVKHVIRTLQDTMHWSM